MVCGICGRDKGRHQDGCPFVSNVVIQKLSAELTAAREEIAALRGLVVYHWKEANCWVLSLSNHNDEKDKYKQTAFNTKEEALAALDAALKAKVK